MSQTPTDSSKKCFDGNKTHQPETIQNLVARLLPETERLIEEKYGLAPSKENDLLFSPFLSTLIELMEKEKLQHSDDFKQVISNEISELQKVINTLHPFECEKARKDLYEFGSLWVARNKRKFGDFNIPEFVR